MAIYHFSGQVMNKISKTGKPKSPLACAAYRSGEKLTDESTGMNFFYNRIVLPDTFILTPEHTPSWAKNREILWNEVNRIEKNYNAQFAREFNVALPVELGKEEQEKLTLEFCQTAFVDKGMVADIAIHRDDENNPHFHVMLTMRPFNEDGTWGVKAKREYLYDENGNHVLDKKGKKAFRKIETTDWSKKETFNSWRKLWADKVNEYLEKNNIDERITHLSNQDRGLETLPTIHEGYVARKMEQEGNESDRVSMNNEINKYNRVVSDLNKYKKEKRQIEYENKFVRKFSPSEKRILSSIAKELKLFVNYTNITERKGQLKQWSKSIQFTKDSESKLKKLNRIQKESELIAQAESILQIESERFIKSYYPTWDIDSLDNEEKIAIVEASISQKRLLNENEIDETREQVLIDHLRSDIDNILHNKYAFALVVDQKISSLNLRRIQLEQFMNIPVSHSEKSLQRAAAKYPKEIKELTLIVRGIRDLLDAKKLMEELYNLEIKKLYPNSDYSHLSLEEKEILIVGSEYYKQPITLDSVQLLFRYSTSEQEEIIRLLTNKVPVVYTAMKTKYPDFQFNNPRYLLLFKEECIRNLDQLSNDAVERLKILNPLKMVEREFDKSEILKKLNDLMDQNIYERSSGLSIDPGYIVGGMFRDILQKRDFASKRQFEEDLKRKSKKKNIHRDGYSL